MITAAQLALVRTQIGDEMREAFRAQPATNLLYPTIARNIPTTGPTYKSVGLGARPGFKKLQDRMASEGIAQYPYEVKDEEYYDLVTIERKAIEDDATSQLLADARRIGEEADPFREQQIINLLLNGRTGVGYDGQPFFNAQHRGGVLNQSGQSVLQTNVATDVLNHDNLAKALGIMGQYVDDKGKSFGIMPDTLLVGPGQIIAASDLLRNDVVGQTVLNSILKPKASALIPGNAWFLLYTGNLAKPLVRTYRTDIGENGLDIEDNIGDRNAWKEGEWFVGARVREGFGYGPWWTGYGSFPTP